MTIQTRDVIFTFDNSCNSDCFKWMRCCSTIKDDDAVYVTPKGKVRRFDFRAKPNPLENARRTLSNINSVLEDLTEDHNKMRAIILAVEMQMQVSLEPGEAHIIKASDLKRIEEIAIPILRNPSPPPSNNTPTPKRSEVNLVRSPEMRDLRV